MVRLKTKVGKDVLEIESQSLKEICMASSLTGMFPDKCACGSERIFLNHKSPKGNEYYGLKCKDCGAELNFHQRKEGGFYLKHEDKFQRYQGGGESSERSESNEGKTFDEDRIPF